MLDKEITSCYFYPFPMLTYAVTEKKIEYYLQLTLLKILIYKHKGNQMYFIVLFQPTGERAVYLNSRSPEKLTVKHVLEWICKRFQFETSGGDMSNRHLTLLYNNTELKLHWFLQDINIRSGSTVKCVAIEGAYCVISLFKIAFWSYLHLYLRESLIFLSLNANSL